MFIRTIDSNGSSDDDAQTEAVFKQTLNDRAYTVASIGSADQLTDEFFYLPPVADTPVDASAIDAPDNSPHHILTLWMSIRLTLS